MKLLKAALLFGMLGFFLILTSIALAGLVKPYIVKQKISQSFRLINGTAMWKNWKDPPVPIYLSFYILHVTNPDDVENGTTPIFMEKGPYSYKQIRTKVNLTQDDGPNTVKYREVRYYYFDEAGSGENSENDLVNIPNLPFLGIINSMDNLFPPETDYIIGAVGNYMLPNETFLLRDIRVGDLLFRGFNVTQYTKSFLARGLPKEFAGGRFGLYKGKNGTESPEWEIYTGYDTYEKLGIVKTWNGTSELNFWKQDGDCHTLRGTDGSIFPPFVTKKTVLSAFSPEICRSLTLVYEMEVEVSGIPAYRFVAPKWMFEDPRVSTANRCYCLKEKLEDCYHAGLLSLESCLKAPMWVSPAGFLDSDSRYLEDLDLPMPSREKYGAYVDIEPTSGVILRAHKRLQFGIEAKSHSRVNSLHNLREVLQFPILWADENAEVNEPAAKHIKRNVVYPLKILNVIIGAILGIGLVLLIVGISICTVNHFEIFASLSAKVSLEKPIKTLS